MPMLPRAANVPPVYGTIDVLGRGSKFMMGRLTVYFLRERRNFEEAGMLGLVIAGLCLGLAEEYLSYSGR